MDGDWHEVYQQLHEASCMHHRVRQLRDSASPYGIANPSANCPAMPGPCARHEIMPIGEKRVRTVPRMYWQNRVLTFVGDVWPFWCVVVEAMVGTGEAANSRGMPDAESPLEWVRTERGLDALRWPMEVPADAEDNSLSDKNASLFDGWGSAPACPALRPASG